MLLSLILVAFSPSLATAQESRESLLWYRDTALKVLENGGKLIRPVLSVEERRIQSQLDISVPVSGESGAYARRSKDGRRQIVISAGMTRTLEWLAIAFVFERHFGFHGCLDEYASYLVRRIAENSARFKNNEPLKPVYPPQGYARTIGGSCQGLPRNFESSREAGADFASMMDASLLFIYLHELAHHTLNHIGNTDSLRTSRAQEAEADAWAISIAFKADFDLVAAAPAFTLIAGLGGSSLEDEVKQTHPLGIRRVLSMLTEAHEIMLQKRYPDTNKLDRVLADIRRKFPSR